MVKDKECREEAPSDHKVCPIFLTLSLIANKWSVRLLHVLMQADKHCLRFSQLQKSLNGISQRELTKHLREFEKAGIVTRKSYPEVPPRVEYTLTTLGHSLNEPIQALASWAQRHGKQIQKNAASFGKRREARK